MELLLFVVMLLILIYVFYRNYKLIGRYTHDKKFIEAYRSLLNQEENAYEKLSTYCDEETSLDLKNKGLLLKLYCEINEDKNYLDTLKQLNLKNIFYKDNKFSNALVSTNIDTFIWVNILLAKARNKSKFDVLNTLNEQLFSIPELDNRLEYNLSKALYNCLNEKEDGGIKFMSDLLEGNYIEYQYDKKLIALYKRFAAASLAYSGELIEDYFKQDLSDFSNSQLGYMFMEALDIYDKYHLESKEENTEE